jgi:modulator of FtsH protease
MYDASLWHDYFVMVGGGGAAIAGLVFVAMSMHLADIASDPTHRHRARTILTGLTAVFIRCALALMGGQGAHAVAAEIFVVLVGVEFVLLRSLSDALRNSTAAQPGVLFRTLGSLACLLVEQAGSVILFLGHRWGLYAIGIGMIASFLFMVSGAWLLLVGVEGPERRPA